MKAPRIIPVIVAILLLAGSAASAPSPAGATSGAASAGGRYVLVPQAAAPARPTGYRLAPPATSPDDASGCCCRAFLPCVIR